MLHSPEQIIFVVVILIVIIIVIILIVIIIVIIIIIIIVIIIIIILIVIITCSVLRQVHSLFRSEFSRERNIMLPLRKQEKPPEKLYLYRIRPSFLICSPVQSPPRNRKFNGPTLG
jgi:hypothetical protein